MKKNLRLIVAGVTTVAGTFFCGVVASCATGSERIGINAPLEVARTGASAPTRHVRILLHRDTFSAQEQSNRVAAVLNQLQREGTTNVLFHIGADPDTPHEAIHRVIEQLRASGYYRAELDPR